MPPGGGTLARGTRVRHYEVIHTIGSGGMGDVYLARDTQLGRRVALKFMRVERSDLAERFLLEARMTARVSHENIVVIHDLGTHQGMPFMVLEHLEGSSLAELLGRGPLPARRAIEIAVDVLRALICAHRAGIVHRDLKPSNIFVTAGGSVKVLDFGIAKLLDEREDGGFLPSSLERDPAATHSGLMGTCPYMSPEQWRAIGIDQATDVWSLGVVLFEMLAGRHPLQAAHPDALRAEVTALDAPMPSLRDPCPDLPAALVRAVDRCLRKRKADRFLSAEEVLGELEPLLPAPPRPRVRSDECPYPGLDAFDEHGAGVFFGRGIDVRRAVAWLRDRPVLGVIGPSGAGKSSFVRAGVLAALEATGTWEALSLRPTRHPLDSLVAALRRRTGQPDAEPLSPDRLRAEPGCIGAVLRRRARLQQRAVVLFVDQLEELYTLCGDPDERRAFTACLRGIADDPGSPVRLLFTMRVDFLDQLAEDREFADDVSAHLYLLGRLDRVGMVDALIEPARAAGFEFESRAMVDSIVDGLEHSAAALPLLQFTASRLWATRDTEHRRLLESSYEAMGKVAGALSSYADSVLARCDMHGRALMRTVFQRLVTPSGTRARVAVEELRQLGDRVAVGAIVDQLVDARLVSVHSDSSDGDPVAEITHEFLITHWPTLRRWIEASRDDALFLDQLRAAARQWDARGRPEGLVWRADAAREAKTFRDHSSATLAPVEDDYLSAVASLATRARRRARGMLAATIVVLSVLVVLALVALVAIRSAEQDAKEQAGAARREAVRARGAEHKVIEQIELLRTSNQRRASAEQTAGLAEADATRSHQDLVRSNAELQRVLSVAKAARAVAERNSAAAERSATAARRSQQAAERATDAERAAKLQIERLLGRERRRVQALEAERAKIMQELK